VSAAEVRVLGPVEVVDDDGPVRMGEVGDLTLVGGFGEPGHREVRRMDAQDRFRSAIGQRAFEVGSSRAVGGPDLDKLRAGAPDDVRDPDATADLDELPARDRDPSTAHEGDSERDRRGGG